MMNPGNARGRGHGRGRGRNEPSQHDTAPHESPTVETSRQAEPSQQESQSDSPPHRSKGSQHHRQAEPTWLAPLMPRLGTMPVVQRSPIDKLKKFRAYPFSGSEGSAEADEWIFKTKTVLKLLQCTEEEKMLCIVTLLKGMALEWWMTIVDAAQDEPKTWADFERMFNQRFMGDFYKEDMRRQFIEIKQHCRPIQEYNGVFIKLLRHASGIVQSEREKCLHYVNSLDLVMQEGVVLCPMDNLDTLMNATLTYERVKNAKAKKEEKKQVKRGTTSAPADYRGSSFKKHKGDFRMARSNVGPTESRSRPTPSLNRRDKSHVASTVPGGTSTKRPIIPECESCKKRHTGECWLKAGRCFKCGGEGHFIRECSLNQGQERRTGLSRSTPSVAPPPRCHTPLI